MKARTFRLSLPAALIAACLSLHPAAQAQSERLTVAWSGGVGTLGLQPCLGDKFTKETGVTIVPEIGTSSVTLAKLQQQKDAPSIDVAWIDGGISELAQAAGVVDTLDPSRIPNMSNAQERAVFKRDGAAYAVNTGYYWIGLTYNTKEISTPPTSWKDLWKPEYEDAVVIPTPANAAGIPFIFFLTKVWGGDPANMQPVIDKLKTLQAAAYYDSSGAATNAFQNGEAIIGAHYNAAAMDMMDKGLPIGIVVPEEGVWGDGGRVHLVKGTPKKELAEKFINMALTPEVSSCLAEKIYLVPSMKNVELSEKAASRMPRNKDGSDALVLFDIDTMNAQRAELTDTWNRNIARKR